jgi:hypothetical protein
MSPEKAGRAVSKSLVYLRGTDGSNPSRSSAESGANPNSWIMVGADALNASAVWPANPEDALHLPPRDHDRGARRGSPFSGLGGLASGGARLIEAVASTPVR